jgi:hypothetical protein
LLLSSLTLRGEHEFLLPVTGEVAAEQTDEVSPSND